MRQDDGKHATPMLQQQLSSRDDCCALQCKRDDIIGLKTLRKNTRKHTANPFKRCNQLRIWHNLEQRMTCFSNSNYTKMRGLIEVQAAVAVAKMTRSMPVWRVVEFAEAASKGLPFYWQFAPSQDPYRHIEPQQKWKQFWEDIDCWDLRVLYRTFQPLNRADRARALPQLNHPW